MGVFDPIAGFGVTFKTMFRKTFTEEYPNGPKVTAPRFHGRHQLNRWPDGLEKCVGCELCAWACPADAIYVEGAQNTDGERFSPGERYGRVYQINYLRCILCGLCIEACPTRALTMTNEYELSSPTRQGLVYDKPDLLAAVPAGAKAPPHTDAEDGPPAIARYGPQASVSQESVEPVWALLRQQESRQADRELPPDEEVPK